MTLILADRVKETTTSTGTTAITLAGAATGYQTFLLAIGNANTTYYTIADQTGVNWEVGIGTYTTIGNTLSRDTVLASSNAGALVVFLTGTKDVFVTYPAERALYTGGPLGTPASGTLTNATGYTYANLTGTVPTWNQSTTGTAATATNLASGSVGTIPYQSASGTTAMLAAGTSGQVLTSNGAAAPTWATASGGGGGTATGASYTNPTAAGTAAAAFGSGASAAANYSTSLGNNSAGSQGSVTATGAGAMALGGSYASGVDSFAAAIGNNTSSYGATAGYNGVAMGYRSKASGTYSVALGGSSLIASGDNSISLGGDSARATGYFSVVLGGFGGVATQTGKYAFGSFAISAVGDSQAGKIVLRATTTTTTAVVLTSDAGAASTTNQLIVASDQAMAIQGTLIAKQSGSGNMAGWNITGIVSKNGGTMAVSGLALTAIGSDSITLGAQPTIAVDNTNKGVTITSGYKASTTIKWVATLNTSEITCA